MPHYALVVMVDHAVDHAALPEMSNRRPRQEGHRYVIAGNDDEMDRLASVLALRPEYAHLAGESGPIIEVDVAKLSAVALDVDAAEIAAAAETTDDVAGSVRLADLEQALARIRSPEAQTRLHDGNVLTVRAYLERIEAELGHTPQS